MKRLFVTAAAAAFLFAAAMPQTASAHSAPPCNDSGEPGNSDYATHHIVPATLGAGAHIPGTEPPRESWRLHPLRGWGDDTTRQVPSRDPRAGRAHGV